MEEENGGFEEFGSEGEDLRKFWGIKKKKKRDAQNRQGMKSVKKNGREASVLKHSGRYGRDQVQKIRLTNFIRSLKKHEKLGKNSQKNPKKSKENLVKVLTSIQLFRTFSNRFGLNFKVAKLVQHF